MKFLIRHKAFINLPMHLESDPPGVIRLVPQLLNAEPSNPREIDLPDDISLDSISSTWEPLDERAKAALVRLAGHRAELRKNAPAPAAEHAAPIAAKVTEPAKLTPADALDFIAALPEEQRLALVASLTEKERAAKERAAAGDTMSGQAKHAGQHHKPKA